MDLSLLLQLIQGPAFAAGGFVLAVLLLSRLMRDQPHPGNAAAWLLGFVFLPFVAVPLYLLVGGRKFQRLSERKRRLAVDTSKIPGLPAEPMDDVGRALARLEGFAPACGGNAINLHFTGKEAWDELMEGIAGAQRSIHICVFILGTDDVARRVVDALCQRAREGVAVRVLVDALGSFRARWTLLGQLRDAGAEVAAFMPVLPFRRKWSANLRNHRKIFIFDEKLAMVGGRNIESHYMGPEADASRWCDFSMLVEGPVVGALCQIFAQDWEFASGNRLALADPRTFPEIGDVVMQTIASGPDTAGDPLHEAILAGLFTARERAWIITPYLIPDQTTLTTLCLLARMGRRVDVVIPRKTDHPLVDFARRHALRELHRAGVHIWLYQPTMVHAKVMVFDRHTALIGSVNADMRSFYFNYEVGVLVYTAEAVAALDTYFDSLVANSEPYTPRHGRWRGVIDDFMENISRLLSPLL